MAFSCARCRRRREAAARQAGAGCGRRCLSIYFERRQTASSTVPVTEAGLVYLSSSAVSELITRFCEFPFKFGNVEASTFVVMVLVGSSTDHVPKLAIVPRTAAKFSSAEP